MRLQKPFEKKFIFLIFFKNNFQCFLSLEIVSAVIQLVLIISRLVIASFHAHMSLAKEPNSRIDSVIPLRYNFDCRKILIDSTL